MVHLIDDEVGGLFGQWALVAAPSIGICVSHVDDGSTASVYRNGFGEDTGSLVHHLAFGFHLEGVESSLEVAFDVGCPQVVACALHLHGLHFLAAYTFFIYMHLHALGLGWGIEPERRGILGVGQFIECLLGGY